MQVKAYGILAMLVWGCCAARATDDGVDLSASMLVPEGLEVTLWARSPMFFNPTRMDVDERGRIWVSEAVNYRRFNTKKQNPLWHEAGDRIVILEDSRGTGKADKAKVFVQDKDLVAPLGVAVIGNKVVVSCSPNLIVYTRDENDNVVKKEILLSGFGGLDHDHGLHKVQCGPDGRWYFNAGNAGPHIVADKSGWTLRAGSWYTGGTPYNTKNTPGLTSDDGRVWSGGVMLRVNSDGTGLHVLGQAMRNPYGTCVDSFGEIWMNDNDDTQSCHTAWMLAYGSFGYNSRDGSRGWDADRRPGQTIPTAHWRQDDPGVIPSGHVYGNGAPTGMAYYEGGALGEKYADGMLLSCEAGQNVVWAYPREVQGAGYALKPFALLRSTNVQDPNYVWQKVEADKRKWFRPSDVIVGTDGAVYVCDWFDAIVGGHKMEDNDGTGAIYRITQKGLKPAPPKYDLNSLAGQIEALKSPAVNVRASGAQALLSVVAANLCVPETHPSVAAVKALLNDDNRFARARAVWVLAQMGDAGAAELPALLKDSDAEIRVTAYRALQLIGKPVNGNAAELARDPSAAARREVALSMRDAPLAQREEILAEIASRYTASDRWYLEALGTGCEGSEEDLYAQFLGRMGAPTLKWSEEFAEIAWRLHPINAIPAFKDRALAVSLSSAQRKKAIDALGFINDKAAADAMALIAEKGPEDLRAYADWWLEHNSKYDWKGYGLSRKTERSSASVRALELRKALLDSGATSTARASAAMALAKSAEGGRILVGLAEAGELSSELKAAVSAQIFRNPDLSVRALASKYFPRDGAKDFPSIDALLALHGDAEHGKQVFASTTASCTNCHKIGTLGKDIGPDLTKINEKFDRRAMLDAILNPSAAILLGYETHLVATTDGEVLTGFIVSDGETVTVKDSLGVQHAIPKSKIARRRQLDVSLMPDNVAMGLKPQELADLLAYLMSRGK
ncbi:MAG TPA: PVC-type heme-binding CxxCH protein [Planctomycetota bacterium]|nr:PVC-type heme-binding CxxCH protein [Planctomycetota bacterium]